MAEVAGGAAVLVDAGDTEAMRGGLVKLLGNNQLQQQLSQAGIERARRFTWKACARKHLEVYPGAARTALQGR